MFAALKQEYIWLLKNKKAIIIILIFVLLSYCIKNLTITDQVIGLNEDSFHSSFKFFVTVGGFLFVSVLSHNVMHRDIESGNSTVCETNKSHRNIFIGKYIGTLLFWYSCLAAVYIIISLIEAKFVFYSYYSSLVAITYFISLTFMISTCISSSVVSNYVGILSGIIIFMMGKGIMSTPDPLWGKAKCLFPYFYMNKDGVYLLIPLVISAGMVGTSMLLVGSKE